jgi:hypothetical protein
MTRLQLTNGLETARIVLPHLSASSESVEAPYSRTIVRVRPFFCLHDVIVLAAGGLMLLYYWVTAAAAAAAVAAAAAAAADDADVCRLNVRRCNRTAVDADANHSRFSDGNIYMNCRRCQR